MTASEILAIVLSVGVGLILLWLFIAALRNPVLIKLGLRNIPRRPAQSLLIILGLTLSTVIFISSLSLGDTLNYSVQRNAIDAYGAVDEIVAPPILSLLTGFEGGDVAVADPATAAEENLNSLLAGGVSTVLTVLEGNLFGISEARFEQLKTEAADEPLIDAVAGSIIFPTIIRDVNSGQGEPLGFIFAVDSDYDQNFGLTAVDGRPVEIESLQPGIGNLFAQAGSLIDSVEQTGAGLGLQDFSLTDAVTAIVAGGAALTAVGEAGSFDLADVNLDLQTLQSMGIDTTPLQEAGIETLSLDALGLNQERLNALGVTTTTVSLDALGINASAIQSTTTNLLGAVNLNTVGEDIDSVLAQAGLQLRQGDLYLNRLGAEQLNAQAGDVVEIFIGPLPVRYRVKAIVEEAGPMGALLPVVMLPLDEAQKLLFMGGKVNNVLVSNLGDDQSGLVHTDAVSQRLRVLAMDPAAVERVVAILRRPAVRTVLDRRAGQAIARVADSVQGPPPLIAGLIRNAAGLDALAAQVETLPAELDKPDVSDELRGLLAENNVRDWLTGLDLAPQDATDLDRALRQLNEFDLLEPLSKSTIVSAAKVGGTIFTSVFSLFGLLSIVAAILLIFLIFVMLAAERRSEIGVARAIGMQRSHVIQMFVAEGVIYDLAAAAVGIALGLAVSYAMIGFIGGLFNNVAGQLGVQTSIFTFHFRVAPTSVVIAYAAGVLFTFLVVTVAAWRVSRMNVVAAIKDLPDNAMTNGGSTILGVLRVVLGPLLLIVAGILLVVAADNLEQNGITLVATLVLVGASLLIGQVLQGSRWRKERIQRLVYTVIGLGLIVLWGTPWTKWLGVSTDLFDQNPNLALLSFGLTAPLVILGAILVVMFNADAWTWAVQRLLGGIGSLAPVLKTAIAYPLSSRFRTGTTMLLFAMVITTVTIMSVVIAATETLVTADEGKNAGFEIEASFSLLSFFDPMKDLQAAIAANPDFPQEEIAAVGSIADFSAEAQQIDEQATPGSDWRYVQISGVNAGYLDQAEQYYAFSARAPGFASDADVWQALRERDDVVVATANLIYDPNDVFRQNHPPGPGFDRNFRNGLRLAGVSPDDAVLPEIRLKLRQPDGTGTGAGAERVVQVIAVLEDKDMLAGGSIQGNAALLAALSGEPVSFDEYYIKVNQGADVHEVAATLERTFLGNALETSILAEDNAITQSVTRGILRLFQGFLALGLLVGIAALGVISTRSVVERRQQVGMLRAIGYQSRMVAVSFLLESSLIALTGIVIGVIAGVVLGREIVSIFFETVSPDQVFALPWRQIGVIVLAAYGFSLLTTLLPAYQASRIYPAEALRYE